MCPPMVPALPLSLNSPCPGRLGRRRHSSRAPTAAAQASAAASQEAVPGDHPWAARAVLGSGTARPDGPGLPCGRAVDADGVPVAPGVRVAARGALNMAVSRVAPSRPATTIAVRRPSRVRASASSSPISKKPGPDGAGVSAVSPAEATLSPRPVTVTRAQSYPRRSPRRVWTAHSSRTSPAESRPSAGSSRSAPPGGLRFARCHGPPGVPAASLITLRPDAQKGAATTSFPLGSAATSPAGKS